MSKKGFDVPQQVDMLLLERKYIELQTLLENNPKLQSELFYLLPYYVLIGYLVGKLCPLNESHLLTVDQYIQCLYELRSKFNYQHGNPIILDVEATKYLLLEFVDTDDLLKLEQAIFEFELKYESFVNPLQYLKDIEKDLIVRKVSYLEATLKLMLNPKQKNSRTFNQKAEIQNFIGCFYSVVYDAKQNSQYYQILRRPLKQLFTLGINLVLSDLQSRPIQPDDFFAHLNNILLKNEYTTEFLTFDLKIVLLYTMAKVVLPLVEYQGLRPNMKNIIPLLQLITKGAVDKHGVTQYTWDNVFQYLVLEQLTLIQMKAVAQLQNNTLSTDATKEKPRLPFIDQLWYHASINFTQLTIKIKNAMKRIVSQKVFALINIYCSRLNRGSLQTKILEDLMITPFEDDILRMKMCINLYQQEEYAKLHQLVQSLLASEKIKDHPFRQIIIDLCCVFTGIYLGKPEEGLCFARLNLHEYEQNAQTSQILLHDTIVAHVGYSYYNLGRNSRFGSEQNIFFAKAIEYLEKSLLINYQNYLVHYNLSRLFAQLSRVDDALTFAKQACSLNKGEVNSLILCAVLYSAKDENQKALMIVDQIIKESPNKPILYLIKASILSEKYLLNLQKDKELKASEHFSSELRGSILKKFQKSKESSNILAQLQKALYGIAKQVSEKDNKDSFTSELIQLKTLQGFDVDPMTYITYRNCLLHTIEIMIKIDFLDIATQVLELVDDGTSINLIEKRFYQGMIQEKSNQIDEACQTYEEVLKDDFYHMKTMSNLALLYLKHFGSNSQKVQRANELLIVASKFEISHLVCYGFALLNQIQGNLELSNEYLLKALYIIKNAPVISVNLVPDRLFYVQ